MIKDLCVCVCVILCSWELVGMIKYLTASLFA